MHYDTNYPSGDNDLMYYYFPTEHKQNTGFMPILVW